MVENPIAKKDKTQALAGLKSEFDGLGILQVNLGALKQEIKDFYEELLHKLEIRRIDDTFLQLLLQSFEGFRQCLNAFKDNEMKHPGASDEIKLQIKEALKNIKISLVALLIGYSEHLQITIPIASNYLSNERLSLDDCIYKSKAEFHEKHIIGEAFVKVNWRNFWITFAKDLEDANIPVSWILEREIKYQLNKGNDEVLIASIEEFYKFIWLNSHRFNSVKKRAELLMKLQSDLKIDYQLLQYQERSNQMLTLKVSGSAQPNYPRFAVGMNFEIGPLGLEGSDRFCGDRIVIIGKESDENYINDITLPNASNLKPLQMVIYCSPRGFVLQDFSDTGVYSKMTKCEPREAKKGQIIRLGFINEIAIKDIEYPSSNPYSSRSIQEGCNIFLIIQGSVENSLFKINGKDVGRFYIGRNPSNKSIQEMAIQVNEKSVSGRHLEFTFYNNKWIIKDISTNGSWIRIGEYQEGKNHQSQNYALEQVPKESILPSHYWIQGGVPIAFGKTVPFFEYKVYCDLKNIN